LFYQINLPRVFISAIKRLPTRNIPTKSKQGWFFRRERAEVICESGICYGLLYRYLLKQESTLAMGLYRKEEGEKQVIRYTVVNPPASLELRADDRVFVFSRERERGDS
jgi:hypothetical protein